MTSLKTRAMMAAVAMALAVPVPAFAFSSINGTRVNPVNANVFEVVPKNSGQGTAIWCAAADYARRKLKLDWQADIYVARGLGQSETTKRRSAVQFTANPGAVGITPTTSFRINNFKVGDHMSVSQANSYCEEAPPW